MNSEIKLKRAIQAAKSSFKQLASQYGARIAKQAYYKVARNQSEKEKLIEKQKRLEEELERVRGELK